MKPYKAFIFIGLTLLLIVFTLYVEKQLNWNTFSSSNPTDENGNIELSVEQDNDTISLTPKENDLTQQSFPYDTVTSNIRMLDHNIFKGLANRFMQADSLNRTARIFYMGDSQLEGDFLASTLRENLQNKYGGNGPGLIAADQYYSTLHQLVVSTSKNWKQSKRMVIPKGNKSLVFRHASIGANDQEAWLKINRLNSLNPKEDYQQLRLFFVAGDSSRISIKSHNQPISNYRLGGSDSMQTTCLKLGKTPGNIEVSVNAAGYFEMECLSLDGSHGVYVDNIPLRGKATPLFNISDSTAMLNMCNALNPDLFILQFGANVIKYAGKKTNEVFRKQTINQIQLIKKWCPDAQILIISISDIAHRTAKGIVSYTNIASLKAIQYEIAMQYGCAFWDLDNYIKQEGGIVSWTKSNPALARNDYLHFTKYGARKIGTKLSELLLQEFEK
ncbi:MAG: hypothetical protein ACK5MI_03775 [Mangrovibacterium sp.]